MSNGTLTATIHEADLKMIEEGNLLARKLNPVEIAKLAEFSLPSVVDYSRYLTLIRNQDYKGGCGTMTSLAILDILKERERPYTPDASFKFAGYGYNAAGYWREPHWSWTPDPRVPADPTLGQLQVLQKYGCCSEALYPTNYDPPRSKAGDPPRVDEWPSDASFAEALLYRIDSFSDQITKPSVEDLKRILIAYGPIFAVGDTPSSPPHGHVFTIVGYDDNAMAGAGAFKIVNSFGDRWGNNGFMLMPYSNITNPPPDSDPQAQAYPRVDWIRWVKNTPTPPFADPFTARIKVHHNVGRKNLTIKIGVEGQLPAIVWDLPNQVDMVDNSLNLAIDVPLPPYASHFWPPNEANRWYVDVVDNSPESTASVVGEVDEVTLVERVMYGSRCIPILHRPSARGFPIPHRGTVRIYVPSKKLYVLTLGVDHSQITSGSQVGFNGMLFLQLGLSNMWNPRIPLANQNVNVFKTIYDPIEGDILEEMIGTAITGPDGKYILGYSPTATSTYRALVAKPDHTVMATSNFAEVKVV